MTRWLAWFFTLLILLQTFSQEVVVLRFQANRSQLAARYCINKTRPRLRCNGRCYLARQLRKAAERESRAPAAPVKLKLEVLPGAFGSLLPVRGPGWRGLRSRHGPPATVRGYAFEWVGRLLRPPGARALWAAAGVPAPRTFSPALLSEPT